jgi:hypothetical protein
VASRQHEHAVHEHICLMLGLARGLPSLRTSSHFIKIKDQVPLEEDLEFTDEALKNVACKSSLEQENEKVLAGSARR